MAAPSLVLGIVVEGNYDAAIISALIPRIHPGPVSILAPIVVGGSGPLMSRFPDYLRALGWANAGSPVDKAIVIRDSNAKDPAKVENDMQAKIAGRSYSFPRGVRLHAVRREIETWLLADGAAISVVAGGRTTSMPPGPLEGIQDAKARLQRVLTAVRLPYTPGVCAEIAKTLDLDVLRTSCPNFRVFEQKVLS